MTPSQRRDQPTPLRDYEVEVYLTVSATNHAEAVAAIERSGFHEGRLLGEALVENVTVYTDEDG